jgi:hypothetical protein
LREVESDMPIWPSSEDGAPCWTPDPMLLFR